MSDDLKEFTDLIMVESPPQPRGDDCIAAAPIRKKIGDESKGKSTMWSRAGRDYFPTEIAVNSLSSGQYVVKYSQESGYYFSERDINIDSLLVLPDSNSEIVLNHIEEFWSNEEVFREYGFLWKRGIMLWGPPGSGKTSLVQQLSKQIVDKGGITVYCTAPPVTSGGLDILRRIEPDRPVVVILEDIDTIVQHHGEADILAMLDGELQVDNIVFIATTNYPGRLDKRFINRPSRFDEIIKIGMPSAEARSYYLAHKNPRLDSEPKELEQWVSLTNDFSVAHLKELIISVECFNKTPAAAVKRLRAMMGTTPDDFEHSDGKKFGFVE